MNSSLWYCYWPEGIRTPPNWKSPTIITDFMLPAYLAQIVVLLVTIQAVEYLLKPLHQPRIVAEIISGILLGPSVLGFVVPGVHDLPPQQTFYILNTVGNFGLLFYVFTVGLELDLNALRELGMKAVAVAVAGIVVPFAVGSWAAYKYQLAEAFESEKYPIKAPAESKEQVKTTVFLIFIGITVSISGFPVAARMITELKLVNSSVGPIAMASSIISSILCFMLLIVCLSMGVMPGDETSTERAVWSILSGAGFFIVCCYVVRPAFKWFLERRAKEDEMVCEMEMGIILAGVAASGFVADVIGMHWAFGAFAYGLAIPNGPIATELIQRLELFMVNLATPLVFFCSGWSVDIHTIDSVQGVKILVPILLAALPAKVIGTVLAALCYSMPLHEGLTLGFLAIAKGPLNLLFLKIGRDKRIVNDDIYMVITIASTVATALVSPLVMLTYRPSRPLIGHRRRQIERSRPDTELRMVACVHNTRHVHTITWLLDFSNPTKRSPIFVCALHLVELTGRASAMLIMHNSGGGGHPHGQHGQSDSIISAFHSYEQHAAGVSVQILTAFSTPNTMHEEVCSLAEERHASLIVLPFHKHQTADGGLVEGSPNVRTVNMNILSNPPCSIAIFVDRSPKRFCTHHSVAVLFFGGPDDREALAYAARMAEHPAINLTVVRFVEGATSQMATPLHHHHDDGSSKLGESSTMLERDAQRMRDDEMLNEFRLRFVSQETVLYTEKVLSNSEDTVAVVRSMESAHDLYVVGRGGRPASPLTVGLDEFIEYPELGPIGDLLISGDFGSLVSVLVVQQHTARKGSTASTAGSGPAPLPRFQNF